MDTRVLVLYPGCISRFRPLGAQMDLSASDYLSLLGLLVSLPSLRVDTLNPCSSPNRVDSRMNLTFEGNTKTLV